MAHFCPNCGSAVQDGVAFCPNCGMSLTQPQPTGTPIRPTPVQPNGNPSQPYVNPNQPYVNPNQPYVNPNQPYVNPNQPIGTTALPMNWFKFLIYFALFAGAVLNFIAGINLLSGNSNEMLYRFVPGLQTLDILYGLVVLVMAGLAVYTRFQLSAYRAKGPKLLTLLYVINLVSALVYTIGTYMCVDSNPYIELNESALTSNAASMAVCVAMIFVNKTYFQKRASLFVK